MVAGSTCSAGGEPEKSNGARAKGTNVREFRCPQVASRGLHRKLAVSELGLSRPLVNDTEQIDVLEAKSKWYTANAE